MKRIISMLVITAFMASCGSGDADANKTQEKSTDQTETKMEETTPVKTETMEAKEVSLEVKTTGELMTDMAFEPKRLEVPAGAKVKVTLMNTAKSEAMIHNFVLINAGTQEEVATQALEAGPDKDYIPENSNVLAATSMAKPGETVVVEFTAPTKAGTYQYICTYPGHTAMKGVFLVK
ncbi:plastocyanin/azurin family copper-binding protein [Owenweeksia hongkongensis]|uniref:plastocyanin/azurin family copper-binding protein n=1 Tax=Owenweeksia hongkongensis TaxID=253245 RepID=UPI003A8C905B